MTIEQLWSTAGTVALGLVLVTSLRTIRDALKNSDSAAHGYLTRSILKLPIVGPQLQAIISRIRALQLSEADIATRYRTLTDHVAAAVMLHQGDGTILWCSPYTEVLTGYALSEIYRNKESFLRTSVHEDDRESLERALAIVSTGEPYQCRYRFYHRSGMTLWVETRTVPILDATRHNHLALSIVIDVTANVSNQLQIEERSRDLHEFTYMVSHDLKAPILTIKGMLGILSESEVIKRSQETFEPLTYISKAVTRLEQLVQGVLELARVSSLEQPLVRVDLSAVLAGVQNDFKRQIEEAHAEVLIDEHLPAVLGTETYLYQIFSNLLGNALKYRDHTRDLRISVASSSAATSRRRVQITVADTGGGIAPDKLELIFKPFHRIGDGSIEGSGVGLASVKKLVEKIRGTIFVESALGVGTTFTIELRTSPEASVGTELALH